MVHKTAKTNTRHTENSFKRGFTLIETFVAITILMMVIVAPLTLTQKSLSADSLTKEKMTAYFLAQDMIEYVRSMRDNNIIESQDNGWENFSDEIRAECEAGYGNPPQCTIDTLRGSINECDWEFCPNLDYRASQNVYGYGNKADGWEPSLFKRGMRITFLNTGGTEEDEISIKVVVAWDSENFGYQEITLRDTLLDW